MQRLEMPRNFLPQPEKYSLAPLQHHTHPPNQNEIIIKREFPRESTPLFIKNFLSLCESFPSRDLIYQKQMEQTRSFFQLPATSITMRRVFSTEKAFIQISYFTTSPSACCCAHVYRLLFNITFIHVHNL